MSQSQDMEELEFYIPEKNANVTRTLYQIFQAKKETGTGDFEAKVLGIGSCKIQAKSVYESNDLSTLFSSENVSLDQESLDSEYSWWYKDLDGKLDQIPNKGLSRENHPHKIYAFKCIYLFSETILTFLVSDRDKKK